MRTKIKKFLKKLNFYLFNFLNLSKNFSSLEEFIQIFFLKKNITKEEVIFYDNLNKLNKIFFFKNKKTHDLKKKKILKEINTLLRRLDCLTLLKVYQIALYCGQLEISYHIKKLFLKKKESYIFKSRFVKKINLIKKIEKLKSRYSLTGFFSKISIYDDNFKKLSKIFNNKKIILVGKSPGETKVNLKNYDSIFFFIKKRRLSKCNIKLKTFLILNDGDFKDCLKKNKLPLGNIILKETAKKYIISNYKNLFFINNNDIAYFGNLTTFMEIVIYLTSLKIKKLYIANVTLYLPFKGLVYDKYYKEEQKNKFPFYLHDPLLNFIILKKLFKTNLITGDKNFKKLMSLTELNYMKEMEKHHGINIKKNLLELSNKYEN